MLKNIYVMIPIIKIEFLNRFRAASQICNIKRCIIKKQRFEFFYELSEYYLIAT